MPIRIKPVETLKAKFSRNGAAAAGDYAAGIASPRRSQADASRAAKQNWADGTQEAISENRYEQNITPESEAKWKRNSAGKGKDRFPGGITAAADDWATGAKPILDALANVPDMPRGVKGSEQNFQRQRAYAMAAHAAGRA